MGFDTPAGTRGARQPRGGLMLRWMNMMAARRIRRTGKMMGLGFNALVLTTVGRKSGLKRTTPVGWFPGPDSSWLVVASAAGAPRHPEWYLNLAANPGQVEIDVKGRVIPVTAEELHGAERAAAWQEITAAAPRFADYQRKTDRELPVIRLAPRPA